MRGNPVINLQDQGKFCIDHILNDGPYQSLESTDQVKCSLLNYLGVSRLLLVLLTT